METVSHIACLSNHWTRVVHMSFDSSRVRPGFARWVEDPESKKARPDGMVMWFAFVRKVARMNKAYFPRMLWVLREERGRGGRYHMHALINGWLNPSVMSEQWKWGWCSAQEYRADGGINDYVCKCLGIEVEIARFSGREYDLGVTFSTAAQRLIRGLLATGLRSSR